MTFSKYVPLRKIRRMVASGQVSVINGKSPEEYDEDWSGIMASKRIAGEVRDQVYRLEQRMDRQRRCPCR